MSINIHGSNHLYPYVLFDWRLIAERGLQVYSHQHDEVREGLDVAHCEIEFLVKMSIEERLNMAPNVQYPQTDSYYSNTDYAANNTISRHHYISRETANIPLDEGACGTLGERGSATKKATQFKCTGAIRKAGFLSVKKWILKRRQSIELARKRGWKRYWVCLKGTTLLFHSLVDSIPYQQQAGAQMAMPDDTGRYKNIASCIIETEPRHLIIVDGSIAQPVPEHPKRDHVFCLSTTFGDAYLFQSSCQLETDNWIGAIHNACAASLARDQGRSLTIRLLSSQIEKISLEAELKTRLRHRLEIKLSSMLQQQQQTNVDLSPEQAKASNHHQQQLIESRAQLCHQLQLIYVSLEQLHCEAYRLRCYLASCKNLPSLTIGSETDKNETSGNNSMIGVDLPHTKTLLMHVSKPTKLILNKLGVFTVSSFHAYVCARAGGPNAVMNHLNSLLTTSSHLNSQEAQRQGLFMRGRSLSSSAMCHSLNEKQDPVDDDGSAIKMSKLQIRLPKLLTGGGTSANTKTEEDFILIEVPLIDGETDMNGDKILCRALIDEQHNLNPYDYFILLKTSQKEDYIPNRKETVIQWPKYDHIRIEKKISYVIRLTRESLSQRFGFSVEAQLVEQNSYDELCVFCSRVEATSIAQQQGLKVDDEITIINGQQVSDLDMMFIENTLQEELSLLMTIKSCRLAQPASALPENSSDLDGNFNYRNGSSSYEGNRKEGSKGSNNQYSKGEKRGGDNQSSGKSGAYHRDPVEKIDQQCDNYNLLTDEYIASLVCPPPPPRPSSIVILRDGPSKISSSTMEKFDTRENIGLKSLGQEEITDDLIDKFIVPSPSSLINEENDVKSIKDIHEVKSQSCKSQHDKRNNSVDKNPTGSIDDQKDAKSRSRASLRFEESKGSKDSDQQHLGNIEYGPLKVEQSKLDNKPEQNKKPIIPTKPVHVKEAMRSIKDGRSPPKELSFSTEKKLIIQGTTNVERLRKSILELLETERTYVDHLNSVLDLYMEPLKKADYLQVDDIRHLFGTITDITSFQRAFYESLEKEVMTRAANKKETSKQSNGMALTHLDSYLILYNSVEDFSDILLGVAGTFLSYADKFKLYSTFCASYSKLQKLLHPTSVHQSNSSASLLNESFASNGNSTFFSHQSNSSAMSASSQAFIYAHKLNEFFVNLRSSTSDHQQQKPNNNSSSSSNSSHTSTLKKHQHQQNFESYLIKPIQRIVKYPLLLSSLIHLSRADSYEHKQLTSAMKQMEQVAGHINDMQRIHEEYGFIFDHLQRQYGQLQQTATGAVNDNQSTTNASGTSHQSNVIDLNVGELLYYGGVDWLNMHEFSGKVKKSQELYPIIFVFSSAVVFLCKERIRQRKKLSMPLSTNKLTDVVEVIRYQALIPVSEVQVRSLPASNGSSQQNLVKELKTPSPKITELASSTSLTTSITTGNLLAASETAGKQFHDCRLSTLPTSFQWELFKCCPANVNAGLIVNAGLRRADGKVYLFSNSTNELRNAFLRKIRYIIRESVRNMNVPLARSPSSKSTSSKKMTSSSSSSSSVSSPLAPPDTKNRINQNDRANKK